MIGWRFRRRKRPGSAVVEADPGSSGRPGKPDQPGPDPSVAGLRWWPGSRSGLGYVQTLQTVMAVNRALLVLLLGTLAIIAMLGVALMSSREWITVYVPPDTTRGAVLTAGVPEHATVYGFAWQTLAALNHWPQDGQDDYPHAIRAQVSYLSTPMRRWLQADRDRLLDRFGINELGGRTRALHPVDHARYAPQRVQRLADGVWGVQVDARLVERVEGVAIKDILLRYRLRVVRSEVNPRGNVWGLVLDGFLEPPERLEPSQPTASRWHGWRGRIRGKRPETAFQQALDPGNALTQHAHFLAQFGFYPGNIVLDIPLQMVQVKQDPESHGEGDPGIPIFHQGNSGQVKTNLEDTTKCTAEISEWDGLITGPGRRRWS